ncbi:MAG: GNAT family N-acetyltransferase [Tannerella sp.]|jgi:ribosomal protein S18 acetylase RimI-like enzyme|nr:GNAT family N-acetyltransferase [Tannerella sp.]
MKETTVTVRRCDFSNAADIKAFGELLNAYIADEMGGGKPLTPSQQTLLTEKLDKDYKSAVLLALCDGVYCGMLVAFENFSTFTMHPMLNIHDVIVLKEYRGRGIGRKLLEKIVETADGLDCSRVTLEVRHDNLVARNLYASLDFKDTSPPMYYWRRELNKDDFKH